MTTVGSREIKYTLKSKALAGKRGINSWTCTNGDTLCKAVVPITVQTLGARVFVPDGRTKMTIFATSNINDGKTTRMMQVRLAAAGKDGWGRLKSCRGVLMLWLGPLTTHQSQTPVMQP